MDHDRGGREAPSGRPPRPEASGAASESPERSGEKAEWCGDEGTEWSGGSRERSRAPQRSVRVPPPRHPGDDHGSPARGEHPHARWPSADDPAGPLDPEGSDGPGPAGPRTPLRRSSVRGQILSALRSALDAGELVPGEVYSAPVLGDRFGVSATPVREAMQQLAAEGAVETVPNRGFRVVSRTPRDLSELSEIRLLIELPTVSRLARDAAPERLAALRPPAEATLRAAEAGDRGVYAQADRAFHRAVLTLCGNDHLVRVADDLHLRGQWPTGRGRGVLVADAVQHVALVDALVEGDIGAVRDLVRGHFAAAE
ncbi:FCD domain-containing protein [Streptomyces sp. NPDC049954]|uniref:GntR family transcriptional regulator n=1 Tax=Streptomyces sp. NPDC049954 TaxID=3155779 RepID=UPI00341BC472